jgi:hypothetical protein
VQDDWPFAPGKHGLDGIDVTPSQARRCHRDMVIGDPARFGHTAGFLGGQLPRIFAIRAVVDDRPDTGIGERLDVGAIEPAGSAHPGSERGERRRNGRHLWFSAEWLLKVAPRRRGVTRKIRDGMTVWRAERFTAERPPLG